ncbi:fumarylacetoacetate hydrolase family protein [Blastococcus sp. SYSU DS0510]
MTHVVRYEDGGGAHVGVLAEGRLRRVPEVADLSGLLAQGLAEARTLVERASGETAVPVAGVRLLPPVDGLTEVWASGVTYERSMDARVEESQTQDVYARVYAAERPELFLKSVAWRVVTDGEPIAVRPDSAVTVPEPELAAVVTATGEVFGYTVCDDVSSRDIEGENPLYLPQAKIYAGSCALATGIRPAWEVPDPAALGISVRVTRGGATVFEGSTSTARMRRSVPDLVAYLVRAQEFPAGAVLSTGTGIVPGLDFTLLDGDVVEVTVEEVGTLSNPVGTLEAARAASALRLPAGAGR